MNLRDEIMDLISARFSKYNLEIKESEFYNNDFFIILNSVNLNVKLESYHGEIYCYIFSPNLDSRDCNIFNILQYLYDDIGENVHSKYYHNINPINEQYKMQILYLVSIFDKYYPLLIKFADPVNYSSNSDKLNEFMITKYPNLFK